MNDIKKLDIESPPGEDISKILDSRRKSWMKGKKFEEELEGDKIQAEVLREVIKEVEDDEHHKAQFQETLDRILLYTPLQVVLLVLAIIDVAVVVCEILVTLHVYDIEGAEANDALEELVNFLREGLQLKSVYVTDILDELNKTLSDCFLNQSSSFISQPADESPDEGRISSSRHFYNPNMLERSRNLLRIKRHSDDLSVPKNGLPHNEITDQLHVVEKALNITSIVILGIFLVVAVLKIMAEGKHFFRQIMEMIDAIVVTLSFILDIIKYAGVLDKDTTEAAIVLLLLWQIVRMFNGIMLSELKRLEFRIKLLKRARKKVESKAATLSSKMKQLEREMESLKKLSRQKGALEDEIVACKPANIIGKPSALAGLSCIASMSVGLSISTPIAVDLMEHRHNLLQSLSKVSKGSFTSSPSEEVGGVNLVAMFPSDDFSSLKSNAVETEESTADGESTSPAKKVTFKTGDDDDDGDGEVGVGDNDVDDNIEGKVITRQNSICDDDDDYDGGEDDDDIIDKNCGDIVLKLSRYDSDGDHRTKNISYTHI